jgi:hypothetical protein
MKARLDTAHQERIRGLVLTMANSRQGDIVEVSIKFELTDTLGLVGPLVEKFLYQ